MQGENSGMEEISLRSQFACQKELFFIIHLVDPDCRPNISTNRFASDENVDKICNSKRKSFSEQ